MAVLGKIRQRSFFLIIIIALALFSFVLADVLQNGTFSGGNNIGSVNGTDIDAQAFMQRVAQSEKQNPNMSGTQAINNLWEQEIRNIIIDAEIKKLGLSLSDEQVVSEIKKNPYFAQNPQFLNAAGTFDENKFREFVKSIKNDPNQERWNEWKKFEQEVEKFAIQQLYYNLIKGGVYTTKAEGKFKFTAEAKKVDFDYVTVPYATVNDNEVKVSDDEIIAYMKKYPKKYKSENTRNIEYVLFESKPSAEDSKALEARMNTILNGGIEYNDKTQKNDTIPAFKDITNVAEFVNKNSDIKFDSAYVAKKNLPIGVQEELFKLANGAVYGPYLNNGYQCISRMLGRKANESARASHILIAYQGAPQSTATRTKEEAKTLANQLLAKARAKSADFAALATENTDDPGSKNNGGEYDNITPGQMVAPFNDFVFKNGVGTIGLVETDYGYHIIKISEKYDAVLLATVAQKIEPSETTIDALYTKATHFEANANEKSFADVAKDADVQPVPANGLKASDEYISGLGAQREIVRWAFSKDTKKDNVKGFEITQGYVVAKLTDKNETGLLSIDVARGSVGTILMNEKKAAVIKKRMSGKTLEEVAKATGGSVANVTDVTLGNNFIMNIGAEPKVTGKAFGLAQGKTSDLIEGNSGVFIIRNKRTVEAPAITNFASYVSQEKQQAANMAQTRAYQALKEKADIEDNRNRM